MLAGFNHNVMHKGKPYHVQTEDSGVGNPHVITHLFVGGTILASKRTSYADIVGAGDLPVVVRAIMEKQHKEILRNLVKGVYDEVDPAYGEQARAYQPGQIAAPDAPAPPMAPPAGRAPRPRPALTPPPVLRRSVPPVPRAARVTPPAQAVSTAPPMLLRVPVPARPSPAARDASPETLFGEHLLDERSLDEVILSCLAEDLGGRK
jgi:hypothetical protein